MRYTQSNANITNDGSITDGVVLAGTGIWLTNTVAGRIIGDVVFAQGGNTLVNELGGIIRTEDNSGSYSTVVILGSSGDDVVINGGLISGLVNLGDGNDQYTSTAAPNYSDNVDLGSGDDYFRYQGTGSYLKVNGGIGSDRLSLAISQQSAVYGDQVTGFEALELSGNGQFFKFSGYRTIMLGTPVEFGLRLGDSSNPLVDLALAGNSISLYRSSLKSITGSDAAESLEVGVDSAISGKVDLSGGNDRFTLFSFASSDHPTLPLGGVDGGAGKDGFYIQVSEGGAQAFDLSHVSNFETLAINLGYQAKGTATLSNATGFTAIDVGGFASLVLRASDLSNANLSGALGGSITLDAASTIARYGFSLDSFQDQRTDIAQGDDRLSVALVNQGRIAGDVVFYIGDDLYDGSAGSVGGTVYGNAGNDILRAGAGNDRLEGGYGNDVLSAGAGNDRLDGGLNSDVLDGGVGDDILIGGGGNDRLDGGLGTDSAVYAGLFETYAPVIVNGVTTLRGGNTEGTDTLASVEYVTFKDGVLISDPDAAGSQIIRLYHAVLGRAPDNNGLDFYLDRIEDQGGSLAGVANDLTGSAEFQAATGGLNNSQFVDYAYQHALGRAADAGGNAYYTAQLETGMSRGALVIDFSESAEHRALTKDLVAEGYFNTDDSYQAVALLYDGFAGRLPDIGGLTYYGERVKSGQMTLAQVTADFAGSAEFQSAIAGKGNGQIIDYLYQNTLDRLPDAGGRTFYVDKLAHGASAANIIQELALSAEHYNLYAAHISYGIDIM